MQSIYEQIKAGKRVATVTTRELPLLRMWLWRNGYAMKSNCNGDVCDVLIEQKSEN